MKRLLTLLMFTLSTMLFTPALTLSVSAQTDVFNKICSETPSAEVCQEKERTKSDTASNNSIFGPNGILTRVARILALAVGIASVIMVIIGGLKFVASTGDSAKAKSARDTIIYALVGLFVAILAQSIIVFVLQKI